MSTKRTKPRPYLEQCLRGFLGLSSLPSQQVPEESIPAEPGQTAPGSHKARRTSERPGLSCIPHTASTVARGFAPSP